MNGDEITIIGHDLSLSAYDVFLDGEPLRLCTKVEFVLDINDPDGTAKVRLTLMPKRLTIIGKADIQIEEPLA